MYQGLSFILIDSYPFSIWNEALMLPGGRPLLEGVGSCQQAIRGCCAGGRELPAESGRLWVALGLGLPCSSSFLLGQNPWSSWEGTHCSGRNFAGSEALSFH